MVVRSFTFDPELTDRFVRFGSEVCRGDANCIPPFESDIRSILSERFFFYHRAGNCHRHFLAFSGDRVIGRTTAFVNRELRDRDDTSVGTVGFFDCDPDYAVAEALLEGAVTWLVEEHGMRRVWGPMNFDIWHGYRFMTRGHERKQLFGEPYNPPFYPEFFTRFGFTQKEVWETVELAGEEIAASTRIGSERLRRLLAGGYRFEPFNRQSYETALRILHGLVSDSYRGFLGFTPISATEFGRLFRRGLPALDPQLFILARNPNGEPVGFAGAFIEISDALRAMGTSQNPLSKIRFVTTRCRTRRLLFYMIGIVPGISGRGFGLGSALHASVFRRALDRGYDVILAALMSSGSRSRSLLGGITGDATRQYALYELNP